MSTDVEGLAWLLNSVEWPDGMGDDDYSRAQAATILASDWLAARDAAIAREAAERALRVAAKDAANHYTDDSATGYAIWLWNTNYADALAASLGDGNGT